jgi:hypothetical protein
MHTALYAQSITTTSTPGSVTFSSSKALLPDSREEIEKLRADLEKLKESLKSSESEFREVEPVLTRDSVSTLPPPTLSTSPKSFTYLEMSTTPYCGVCVNWENSELPKVQAAGIGYSKVDRTVHRDPTVLKVPTFRIKDETGKTLHEWVGYTSASTLITAFTPRPVAQVVVAAPALPSPIRHYPQYGTINLETYGGCSSRRCDMCATIRADQAEWRRQVSLIKAQPIAAPVVAPKVEDVSRAVAPTPPEVITAMLSVLKLDENDVLADLGCGDARILIQAVETYGCTAVGVEIDPAIATKARQRVKEAGLQHKIQIITGDVLEFEPYDYGITAATVYLYPPLLEKLAPKLKRIPRVASPFHSLPGLPTTSFGDVYLYTRT